MIEMKTTQKAGETPAQITVSMIDQDLKDGISKPEMVTKYGIKPWEVDEMFKHPLLKGRRPSRKKKLSFSFVDDMSVDQEIKEKVEAARAAKETTLSETDEIEEEFVNPNQVTLEQAIDEAIDTVEEVKDQMQQTQEAIVDMLSPSEFHTNEDLVEQLTEIVEEEEELEVNDDTFEL